jgi:uncharacterized protein with von Willebrand factor type A (vWA) domain
MLVDVSGSMAPYADALLGTRLGEPPGWERGDPELLAARMRRLHRLAQWVIRANPINVLRRR